MLESIRANDGADAAHTLNTLTHVGDVMKVEYEDPEGHDRFYRFMATIQSFFDEAKSRGESSWVVNTGEAQVQMWDSLLAGMFENVIHLKNKPGPGQSALKQLTSTAHIQLHVASPPPITNERQFSSWYNLTR